MQEYSIGDGTMVRLKQSWSSKSATSATSMRTAIEIGSWVFCVGGIHKGVSGHMVKKHAVMVSFKADDGCI